MNFLTQTTQLIQLGITLVVVFAAAIAFFDALRRTEGAFEMVGRGPRSAWLIGMGLSAFAVFFMGIASMFGLIGTVATVLYHVDQKPKLNGVF